MSLTDDPRKQLNGGFVRLRTTGERRARKRGFPYAHKNICQLRRTLAPLGFITQMKQQKLSDIRYDKIYIYAFQIYRRISASLRKHETEKLNWNRSERKFFRRAVLNFYAKKVMIVFFSPELTFDR